VPFVARWPGRIPADNALRGRGRGQYLPLLEAPCRRQPVRHSLIHHSAAGQFAIREGPWKLIVPLPPGGARKSEGEAPQLYRLDRDLAETEDLAAREPDVASRLAKLLEAQRAGAGAVGAAAEGQSKYKKQHSETVYMGDVVSGGGGR
jgi:arylsulfatase A-like enzyme